MSTKVTITNRTNFLFKCSLVFLSEIDNSISIEKYWESKDLNSNILTQRSTVFGKLFHPDELPNSANFIVSIILAIDNIELENRKDDLLVIKARIKRSKTGFNAYAYASSFPELSALTKPRWQKENRKNFFLCKFYSKVIQITHYINWNNNVCFVIEQLNELPAFIRLQRLSCENVVIEDFYENQWKRNILGRHRYSNEKIFTHDQRPCFSTVNGDYNYTLPKLHVMPPSPLWTWIDEWCLDSFSENEEGWIYYDDWKSPIEHKPYSTKYRFRRWIRKRSLKKNILDRHDSNLELIFERFQSSVLKLEKFISPFLKELKKEIYLNPESFDFDSMAAIPSPRMRRELNKFAKKI